MSATSHIIEGLSKIFTEEQMQQLTDLYQRVQGRAVQRHSEQSVTVIFNEKGFPRHFNGSDNVNPAKPKNYVSE